MKNLFQSTHLHCIRMCDAHSFSYVHTHLYIRLTWKKKKNHLTHSLILHFTMNSDNNNSDEETHDVCNECGRDDPESHFIDCPNCILSTCEFCYTACDLCYRTSCISCFGSNCGTCEICSEIVCHTCLDFCTTCGMYVCKSSKCEEEHDILFHCNECGNDVLNDEDASQICGHCHRRTCGDCKFDKFITCPLPEHNGKGLCDECICVCKLCGNKMLCEKQMQWYPFAGTSIHICSICTISYSFMNENSPLRTAQYARPTVFDSPRIGNEHTKNSNPKIWFRGKYIMNVRIIVEKTRTLMQAEPTPVKFTKIT